MSECNTRAVFFADYANCKEIEQQAVTYVSENQAHVADVYHFPKGDIIRYFYDTGTSSVIDCPSLADVNGVCNTEIAHTVNNGGHCLPFVDALLLCSVAYILTESARNDINVDTLIQVGLGNYINFIENQRDYLEAIRKLHKAVQTVDQIIANNGLTCADMDNAKLRLLLLYALNPADADNAKAVSDILAAAKDVSSGIFAAHVITDNSVFGVDYG